MPINDPRDIPGLLFWLSAEAEAATYLDGQTMTQWSDLSGNNNHHPAVGTPTFRATAGAGGGPAVEMVAGHFELSPNVLSGATAAEVHFRVKSNAGTTDAGVHGIAQYGTNGNRYYGDGSYRESFGRFPAVTGTFSDGRTTAWQSYVVIGGTLASRSYFRVGDSSALATYDGNPSSVQDNWLPTSVIGAGARGADGLSRARLNGHMAAAVAYGRELTTTERADLEAWISANPNGGTLGGPVEPSGQISATAPSISADIAADATVAPIDAALSATAPVVSAALTGEQTGVGQASLAGVAPPVSGDLAGSYAVGAQAVTTDSVDRSNGMTLVTEWDVTVEPPVVAPTRELGHDYAVATSTPEPTMIDGRPT